VELPSLLTGIEACLNSRPLCIISNEPHVVKHLTPSHFIIGEPLTKIPSHDFTNMNVNQLSRWQQPQQPEDAVLIKEGNLSPLERPLAVITDVHPGSDGYTRVVTILASKGFFKRPVHKICPVPPSNYLCNNFLPTSMLSQHDNFVPHTWPWDHATKGCIRFCN
jgi:hypothetical protein